MPDVVSLEVPRDVARRIAGGSLWGSDRDTVCTAAAAVVRPAAVHQEFDRAFWHLAPKGEMSIGHHLLLCDIAAGRFEGVDELADELAMGDPSLVIYHGTPPARAIAGWLRSLERRGLVAAGDPPTLTASGRARLARVGTPIEAEEATP